MIIRIWNHKSGEEIFMDCDSISMEPCGDNSLEFLIHIDSRDGKHDGKIAIDLRECNLDLMNNYGAVFDRFYTDGEGKEIYRK
jgi:hypothetical protein